jgi:hypothetical protein
MNSSNILNFYTSISRETSICEDILNSLSSLSDFDINILKQEEGHGIFGYDKEFELSEIARYNLPSDFVEAVYLLSKQEFWDCFRYNTFKPFERLSPYKTLTQPSNPGKTYKVKRSFRDNSGYNYEDWIYKNRFNLLYISRFDLLKSCMQFITSEEAKDLYNKIKVKYPDYDCDKLVDISYSYYEKDEEHKEKEDEENKEEDEENKEEDEENKEEDEEEKERRREEKYERFLDKIKRI